MQDNQREELIYLAGLFDGEGTICIQKDSRPLCKDNGKNWNPIYNVTVRIGMTDEKSIQTYADHFRVGKVHAEKTRRGHKQMFRWAIRSKNDVIFVINQMIPFLRLKKTQGILGLRFYTETPSMRGRFLTPENLAKKEEFYLEMKKLNGNH